MAKAVDEGLDVDWSLNVAYRADKSAVSRRRGKGVYECSSNVIGEGGIIWAINITYSEIHSPMKNSRYKVRAEHSPHCDI